MDKNGHDWKRRDENVCPFICNKCGALSGTGKSMEKCKEKVVPKEQVLNNINKTVRRNKFRFLDI